MNGKLLNTEYDYNLLSLLAIINIHKQISKVIFAFCGSGALLNVVLTWESHGAEHIFMSYHHRVMYFQC